MPNYAVLINGQNYLLDSKGKRSRVGFYTTCYVEAQDLIHARYLATEQVRNDPSLAARIRNTEDDRPTLIAAEIQETDHLEPYQDLVFYSEEPNALTRLVRFFQSALAKWQAH
jgi:hypothetical protein